MPFDLKHIFIFKTDIHSDADVATVQPAFDRHDCIKHWSVDTEDRDRVLRVVSSSLSPTDIIKLVSAHGYQCIELE